MRPFELSERFALVIALELAYLYAADVRRLLTQAGFHDITIRGGFDGHELSRDTDDLVVEASACGRSICMRR